MVMKNILYIPLDERPCNADFVPLVAKDTDYKITIPKEALTGNKKIAADTEAIWAYLFDNINCFDAAILSIDMLLYGGIVPSRLHHFPLEKCFESMQRLRKLKSLNKDIKIYAFHLIMRCPSYSSSDEEPDYYELYGKELFDYGSLSHKASMDLLTEESLDILTDLKNLIPNDVLKDYTSRRSINLSVNMAVLDLLADNSIDFLVIPQDDSAPYGFTAADQDKLRKYIHHNKLNFKAFMYPGADEVGLTLLARLINEDNGLKPRIYPRFSSTKGPFTIPLYEDRLLNETVKYHILSSGGIPVDSLADCDIVLMVNSPPDKMVEAWEQNKAINNLDRNLVEFVEFIDYIIHTKHLPCAIADVAYANGGDLMLIDSLSLKGLLYSVCAYAGWNTNANTLGTSICQAIVYNIYGNTRGHLNFLSHRYLEDCGYCSEIRHHITNHVLPDKKLNYFLVDGKNGSVSELVKDALQDFAYMRLLDSNYEIKVLRASMPWNRMFEVDVQVETVEKKQ